MQRQRGMGRKRGGGKQGGERGVELSTLRAIFFTLAGRYWNNVACNNIVTKQTRDYAFPLKRFF